MRWLLTMFLFVVLFGAPVFSIYAQNSVFTDNALGGLKNSGKSANIQAANGDPDVGKYVGRIIEQILLIVSVIFFLLIVIGGVMWMTSGGSEEQVAKGQSLLRNAIIGFMVTIAAFLITRFVTLIVYKAANPNATFF